MTVSAGLNSVSVYRTVPIEDGAAREDIVGMRVYASTVQNFVADSTTLKYSGSSLSYTITGLLGGVTYYVKTALISSFLGDSYTEDELVIVDETPVITQKAPGSLNVIISTPAVVLQASNSGVVSTYAGSGTTIRVYDGASEVVYDGVGTANGTWKVVASGLGLTVGAITDSGTYATVGDHNNLTVDSTTVTYAITGKTALGSSFSLSAIQTLSKAKSGTSGSQGTRGWTIARITGSWNQVSAESAISAVVTANGSSPTTPIAGDTVFYTGGAKQYSTLGTWVDAGKFIDGNLVVDGTIIGSHLATEFSIQAGSKVIAGTTTDGVVMDSAKHISVFEGGSLRAKMGYLGASGYGFTAYSPTGTLLFDSTKGSALLSNSTIDNYCIGDSTTYPSYNDSSAGTSNIALGANVLNRVGTSSKTSNVAIGSNAGRYLIGGNNVALGTQAIRADSASTSAVNYNVAIGHRPMYSTVSSSHCVAVGYLSGFNTTTGGSNTLVGSQTGTSLTTANYCTYIGKSAGYSNVSGDSSTYLGNRSGFSNLNSNNTFVGANSGASSTSSNSVLLGSSAGSSTSGNNSVAVGYYAAISAESNIVALGYQAGQTAGYGSVTVGSSTQSLSYGVAVGYAANAAGSGGIAIGDSSKSGVDAVVIGRSAGIASSSTGATIVGAYAGGKVTGAGNAFYGYQSGKEMTSGDSNSFFGWLSGANATGSSNSFFGQGAGENSGAGNANVYVGMRAGRTATGSLNTLVGVEAGESSGAGNSNVYVGTHAGRTATGSLNTLVGVRAGYSHTGNYSVVVGTNAGYNSTSDFITVVGRSAGQTAGVNASVIGHASNAGTNSVAVGATSGSTSSGSVSIGAETSCSSNESVTIGYQAGKTAGTNPLVSIGYQSGLVSTGLGNTFIGNYAGSSTALGLNTLVGYKAGTLSNASGNSLFGFKAGEAITTGGNNCLFGSTCGDLLQTGAGNSFFGKGAGHSVVSGSNNVFIGNSSGSACPSDINNAVILGGSTTAASGEIVLSTGDGVVRGKCSSSGNWEFPGQALSQSKVGSNFGGTVTQATSRTTGVTLNAPSGEITLVAASTTAGQVTTFTLTNSYIGANDVPRIVQKTGTGLYFIHVTGVSAGSCKVSVHSVSANSSESFKLSFVILAGAIS